jgi:hypothetical protein
MYRNLMCHIWSRAYLLVLISLAPPDCLADDSIQREFVVGENKTVSEVLFYDMGFTPIYGDGGLLDRVLQYNELDRESARRIRPGTRLILPMEVGFPTRPDTRSDALAEEAVIDLEEQILQEEFAKREIRRAIISQQHTAAFSGGGLYFANTPGAVEKSISGYVGSASFWYDYRYRYNEWALGGRVRSDFHIVVAPGLFPVQSWMGLDLESGYQFSQFMLLGAGLSLQRGYYLQIVTSEADADSAHKRDFHFAMPYAYWHGQLSSSFSLKAKVGMRQLASIELIHSTQSPWDVFLHARHNKYTPTDGHGLQHIAIELGISRRW